MARAPGHARPLRGLDPDRQLDDPSTRQGYVTAIFDLIAPRYDAFTRWFSFGMDRGWKAEVVAAAKTALAKRGPAPVVVDLACGTGDLAFSLSERARVVGMDVSHVMLRAARARADGAADAPSFAGGDMVALPLDDASVDVVTIGYGLRNASRLELALDEATRVLKPGGHLVTLDFYRPANAIWRRLFLGYLALAGNLYGWAWHREPAAYGYIPRSIRRFVTADELSDALGARGLRVYLAATKLLGGICVHAAEKG